MVAGRAYKFKIDEGDLLNDVNNKLAIATTRNLYEGNTLEQFRSWLATVIYNCAINIRRNDNKVADRLISIHDDSVNSDKLVSSRVYQAEFDKKDLLDEVMTWVRAEVSDDKHPKHWKVILEKYFDEEMKYEEIAMIVSIPLGTVKFTIHAIRKMVKRKFGNRYAEALCHI